VPAFELPPGLADTDTIGISARLAELALDSRR
jgi:hypothetical protein